MRRNWFAGIEKCQLQAETLCLNFSTIWSSFCSTIQTLHSWTKINILKRSFITNYKGFKDFSRVHLPCTLLVNSNCNLAHLNIALYPICSGRSLRANRLWGRVQKPLSCSLFVNFLFFTIALCWITTTFHFFLSPPAFLFFCNSVLPHFPYLSTRLF